MDGAKSYIGSCVELDESDLYKMMQTIVPITYLTFRQRFTKDQWAEIVRNFKYAHNNRYGLTMEQDWHVRYYTALYKGREVIVLQHSSVEYIWDDVHSPVKRKLKRQVAV